MIRLYFTKCQICDSTDKLCVHHLTYDNLDFFEVGNEYFSDISVVCSRCHINCHSKMNKVFQLILEKESDYNDLIDILNRSKFGKYSDIDILANIKSDIKLKDLFWDDKMKTLGYMINKNNT